MDDICTICLCSDRKLCSIEQTSLYQCYSQILYEISVYDLSSPNLHVRICWECFAQLRKIQKFKALVKESYWQLLLHINQNTPSHMLKTLLCKPSKLQIHHAVNINYPLIEIKKEFEVDAINETTLPIDNLKSESIDNESHEEPQTFVNSLSIDNGSYDDGFINNLSIDNEMHHEPETFVNNLDLRKLRTKKKDKMSKKKSTKDKPKKKLKVKKKRKEDILDKVESNRFSDVELNLGSQTEKETKNGVIEIENNKCTEFSCKQCKTCFGDEMQLNKHADEKHAKLSKVKENFQKRVKTRRKSISENILDQASNGFSDIESILDLQMEEERKGETKETDNDKNTEFRCKQCGMSFGDEIQLNKHTDQKHAKAKHQKNGEIIKTKRKPKQEVLGEKPECVECGKVFSSRKTYRYHLEVLHKGHNRYPCPRCGKVYQWKSNLGRHMRSHTARDSGELYCDTCDKRFASVATFRQHLQVSRRHVSESEFTFMCNECGKKFVNKTRLRDHIDWEHLKKIKFKCQLCNKAFKCHTSLYVHLQNVHRDKEKKDNLCHVCGKSYQNAAKLKYHIVAMHTSETPYQCQRCSAAFGWYSSLYRHVREVHYKMRQRVETKSSKKTKKPSDQLPPLLPEMALDSLQQPGPAR